MLPWEEARDPIKGTRGGRVHGAIPILFSVSRAVAVAAPWDDAGEREVAPPLAPPPVLPPLLLPSPSLSAAELWDIQRRSCAP
jgi:hypothetical protein